MSNIPNIISVSRGIAALAMLRVPAFCFPFWILYCWCGFSDMIDGALARRLGAVSELGSKIDSIADLTFVICSAIIILPSVDLPLWVWLWVAAIGNIKLAGIIIGSCRQRELSVPHSMTNKEALIPAVIVCISAATSLFEDVHIIRK